MNATPPPPLTYVAFARLDREDTDASIQGRPGTWVAPGPRNTIAWLRALVFCPRCGKCASLSARVHTVDPFGTVTPSWVCPYPPCGFHEHIHLEGWPPP